MTFVKVGGGELALVTEGIQRMKKNTPNNCGVF